MLELWQRILIYAVIFLDLYIFVKLSNIRINNKPLLRLHWRIIIALVFPLLLIIAFMFGAVLLAVILTVLFLIFLFSLFKRKKIIRIRIF